jgi:hypothetical protein
MAKREAHLWHGNFQFPHELVTMHTYAPTWAAAKNRMLRRIAIEHNVDYGAVYEMFREGNYTVEMEEKGE